MSIRVNKFTILLLAALLLAVTSFSLAAEATTPTVKSFTPAEGYIAVYGQTVDITFEVTDPHEIADYNYFIKVDGNSVPTNFAYTSGHWEGWGDG